MILESVLVQLKIAPNNKLNFSILNIKSYFEMGSIGLMYTALCTLEGMICTESLQPSTLETYSIHPQCHVEIEFRYERPMPSVNKQLKV